MAPEDDNVAELQLGRVPLIISLPHVGTQLPPGLSERLTTAGRSVIDTDWNVHQLYAFARDAEVSWLQARYSRYVIDVNRPPDDASLYPGQSTTQLCPTMTFDGAPLYLGAEPSASEIAARREQYWLSYHAALIELIADTRAQFGFAVLLDAHSIRSQVPRLFEGKLPDINLGTHSARSCAPSLSDAVSSTLTAQTRFSHVLNGRFKGGYITRAYGAPQAGVHALQIELAQSAYMDEGGSEFEATRAQPLMSLLRQIIERLLTFEPPGTVA